MGELMAERIARSHRLKLPTLSAGHQLYLVQLRLRRPLPLQRLLQALRP